MGKKKTTEKLSAAEVQQTEAPAAEVQQTEAPAAEVQQTEAPAAEVQQTPELSEQAVLSGPAGTRYRVDWPGGLNLRNGPGMGYTVAQILPDGAEVTCIGSAQEGDAAHWIPVAGGWVNGAYLVPVSAGE